MKRTMAAAAALATAAVLGSGGAASAHSQSLGLTKYDPLTPSHAVAKVRARIVCSPDTTEISAKVTLTQVVNGSVQEATGSRTTDTFECSGDTQRLVVRVRKPSGGFDWQPDEAFASDWCMTTTDPDGSHSSTLSGRKVFLTP